LFDKVNQLFDYISQLHKCLVCIDQAVRLKKDKNFSEIFLWSDVEMKNGVKGTQ